MKPQRHAPKMKVLSKKTTPAQAQKLAPREKRAALEYRARLFRQWVIAGTIAIGLVFMALGVHGGETIVIAQSTLLAGYSLSSKVIGER